MEAGAKTIMYSGSVLALTLQQWGGLIVGVLGLLMTFWLGYRRDTREKAQREEEKAEHEARLQEIRNNPERRAAAIS